MRDLDILWSSEQQPSIDLFGARQISRLVPGEGSRALVIHRNARCMGSAIAAIGPCDMLMPALSPVGAAACHRDGSADCASDADARIAQRT
jgi:hypothetical protein